MQVYMKCLSLKLADDLKSLEFAIVENVQRDDLNPIEEANGYKRLIDEFKYDQDKVAKFIGKSRAHITNCLDYCHYLVM